jgi:hypothetical protein
MESHQFDNLTKQLAAGLTRRRALRFGSSLPFLGGVLGLLLGDRPTAADPGDPERGSSHRRKRRKRRHDPGGDKDHRHGKRKTKGKGKKRKRRAVPASPPGGPTCAQTCAGNTICESGACQPCDVCQDGSCAFLTVLAALAAMPPPATIRICPGAYSGNLSLGGDVTLIGAGDGDDPSANTIIQANTPDIPVVDIPLSGIGGQKVTLEGLRITGGHGEFGSGVSTNLNGGGVLTMRFCTVIGNKSDQFAGGVHDTIISSGITHLIGCTIRDNSTGIAGGGYCLLGKATLTDCVVAGNTASNGGGITILGGTLILENTLVGGTSAENANTAVTFGGGGIYKQGGTVELRNGSLVCGNVPDQCFQFSDPACQDTCPA